MKKKILLALLIVLILLGVGGAYAYFATDALKTGKQVFFTYVSADMFKDFQDEKLTEYLEKQEKTAYTNKGEVTINAAGGSDLGIAEEYTEILNKSKISFEGKTDNNKKLAEQTITADFSLGLNIPINLKRDGDIFGIQSDLLDSKFIALRNENLKALLERFEIDAEEVPDKIDFSQEQFTEKELKTLQKRYTAILNKELGNELFNKERVDNQTVITLKLTDEKCVNILTKILETARDDEMLIDKLSGAYEKEEIQQEIDNMLSDLKQIEIDGNNVIEFKLFVEERKMKKLEISIIEDDATVMHMVMEKADNQITMKIYEESTVIGELSISKETSGNDVSYIVNTKVNSEIDGNVEMNFKIQYKNLLKLDNVEENYEIKLLAEDSEMNLNYKNLKTFSPNVEIEGLNVDNATIINDASDEEIQDLMMTIFQNLGLM